MKEYVSWPVVFSVVLRDIKAPAVTTVRAAGSESPTVLPRLPAALTTGAFAFHP